LNCQGLALPQLYTLQEIGHIMAVEEAVTIYFPQGPCFAASVQCSLPNFTQHLKELDISSPAEWCSACENDSAGVCLAVKVGQAPAPAAVAVAPQLQPTPVPATFHLQPFPTKQEETTCSSASAIAGALFGGIGLGMLFLVLVQIYVYLQTKRPKGYY